AGRGDRRRLGRRDRRRRRRTRRRRRRARGAAPRAAGTSCRHRTIGSSRTAQSPGATGAAASLTPLGRRGTCLWSASGPDLIEWGSNPRRTRLMTYVRGLVCRECGHAVPQSPVHVCESCFGPLEIDYDYAAIRKVLTRERIAAGPPSIWRYRDLLPLDGDPL